MKSKDIRMRDLRHGKDLGTILDCFSGADGAVAFIELVKAIRGWEESDTRNVSCIADLARIIRTLSPSVDEEE